jgi:phage/plasmid-like protein (TIGR03299 family)
MGHELRIENGHASMFYVDEPPWHGLGKRLAKPATAAEAIKAARLDWDVRKVPLYACEGLNSCVVPHRHAIVPTFAWGQPKCPVFGIVGDAYEPLQNRGAFAFFDPIVGEGKAIYHTAGSLGEGERVWVLAKLPESIRVIGDDIADKYLLLSNSHDGQSAVQIKFTPIRVVCQNTLTIALADGQTLRAAHYPDLKERLQQARELLGLIQQRYDTISKAFQATAAVQLRDNRLTEYLAGVFPDPNPAKVKADRYQRALKQAKENRLWSAHFFESGVGNREPGVTGTLWAAYNGVTELVDHRDMRVGANRRLQNVWFGTGYSIKARAFNVALEKMSGWKN